MQNKGGDTPLRKAIYHGHTDCARILIEGGAQFNFATEKNISALHLGVFKGHRDCAGMLYNNNTFIRIFLEFYFSNKKIALLIEKGALVDMRDESGMTPLFFAAVNGHKDCMELLIDHNADVNCRDTEGIFF